MHPIHKKKFSIINNLGKKNLLKIFSVLAIFIFLTLAFPSLAQDPSGANTGTAADVTSAIAGKPTGEEVAAAVGHNKIAINIMWTLIAGFL